MIGSRRISRRGCPSTHSSICVKRCAFCTVRRSGRQPQRLAEARARVALDELISSIIVLKRRQRERATEQTIALPRAQQLGRVLLKRLGFELTGAQRRVTREVLLGLERTTPMLRLIQGDVGSGKTIIAAFAAIRAAEHGCQTAIMAPTEILAEQHFLNFSSWLEPLGIPVRSLTGRMAAADRARGDAEIRGGDALVVVGTHALFQKDVEFARLGLVIIDEQHRFGVHQRMALRSKGALPHQLVMTATPIPRTLTMALYADMDVSVIDELPPGRHPVETHVVSDARRAEVIARIAQACSQGRQAYWVCTLIEESDALDFRAAETTAAELTAALPGLSVGLLHGRLSSREKASVMEQFKAGRIELLVATTVVEVGVDVPNATLIVIDNPERLGLAQLHQLRGRVGRGPQLSRCILLYKAPLGAQSQARLKVLRESNDGFRIAEEDLRLRGPGDVLGTRQTGEQQFRVADLTVDAHLVARAADIAERIAQSQPAHRRSNDRNVVAGQRRLHERLIFKLRYELRAIGKVLARSCSTSRFVRGSADFDHLEVFFADATFGTDEIVGDVLPRSARGDAFILVSLGFVVDPAANDTLPFPHLCALTWVQSQGEVRYLREPENANDRAARRVLAMRSRQLVPYNCARDACVKNRVNAVTSLSQRLPLYLRLMRFDRPVGTLLLLWPTLAALWIASNGRPSLSLVVIFTLGTIVMRAAGCVINDYADRRSRRACRANPSTTIGAKADRRGRRADPVCGPARGCPGARVVSESPDAMARVRRRRNRHAVPVHETLDASAAGRPRRRIQLGNPHGIRRDRRAPDRRRMADVHRERVLDRRVRHHLCDGRPRR